MEIALIVISCLALIVGGLGLSLGIYCVINLEAMKRSTHTIQWQPLEDAIQQATNSPEAESKKLFSKGFAPADNLDLDDEEMI